MPRVPENFTPGHRPRVDQSASEPLREKLRPTDVELFVPKEKYKPRDDLEGGLIKHDEAVKRGFPARPVPEPANH